MSSANDPTPKGQNTRQHILEVASRLFTEKGYKETTTRMIASVANVNEATIFHHFGSKTNLFRDVYLSNALGSSSLLAEGLTSGEDLRQDLYLLFREYTILLIKHIPYYKLSVQHVDDNLDVEVYRVATIRLESMKIHLLTYLNSLKASGKIFDIDCMSLSEFLFSIFLIKAPEFIRDKGPTDIYNEQMVEQFVNSYADYIYRLITAA